MHHAYVSNDAATPKLTLTHFPAILLSFAFPHQTPLTHTLSHFTHLSIPPVSHSPPALTRNTQHLVPICPCALCKEVAALSRGAPAPLFPAHAPRHPAREAKAQSLIWWPGLTAAKAQIQSGGLCECVVTPSTLLTWLLCAPYLIDMMGMDSSAGLDSLVQSLSVGCVMPCVCMLICMTRFKLFVRVNRSGHKI